MPEASAQNTPTLGAYLELLQELARAGLETIVIGGCAVGAYARTLGATVISQDLDLLATSATLDAIVADAPLFRLTIEKLPQPRSVPVAVFRWNDLEVNVLTSSSGLATADVEAQVAREFQVSDDDSFSILVADPFDLLRNKLAIGRPKDLPHIDLLKQFIEEELVAQFVAAPRPRDRIAPIVRYLEVLQTSTIATALSKRLIAVVTTLPAARMLAHRVPIELLPELLNRVQDPDMRSAIEEIQRSRLEG